MTLVNFPGRYRPPPKLPPDAAEDLDCVLVYPDDGLRWIAEGVAGNGATFLAHGTKAAALDAALYWVRRFNSGLHLTNRPPELPDKGGAA